MRLKAKEIAKELGVSEATVSLAFNDRPGINKETKRRILTYIREREEEIRQKEEQKLQVSKGGILMLNYVKNVKSNLSVQNLKPLTQWEIKLMLEN